ncbi:MAG: hypothetical protein H6779_05435 [Candidatus Nomurabacteria bacterium]|nr:MAG: hypothetical protein H6779_05435 [Candidatus Nomurabacteria bacterium]
MLAKLDVLIEELGMVLYVLLVLGVIGFIGLEVYENWDFYKAVLVVSFPVLVAVSFFILVVCSS